MPELPPWKCHDCGNENFAGRKVCNRVSCRANYRPATSGPAKHSVVKVQQKGVTSRPRPGKQHQQQQQQHQQRKSNQQTKAEQQLKQEKAPEVKESEPKQLSKKTIQLKKKFPEESPVIEFDEDEDEGQSEGASKLVVLPEGETSNRVDGVVKWFSPVRHYGFIKYKDGDDVFVREEDVTGGLLAAGQPVEIEVKEVDGKLKALGITNRGGLPLKVHSSRLARGFADREQANPELRLGWVRLWDMAKQFGFLEGEDGSTNLFVHHSELISQPKVKALAVGREVEFEVGPNPRQNGKPMAIKVTALGLPLTPTSAALSTAPSASIYDSALLPLTPQQLSFQSLLGVLASTTNQTRQAFSKTVFPSILLPSQPMYGDGYGEYEPNSAPARPLLPRAREEEKLHRSGDRRSPLPSRRTPPPQPPELPPIPPMKPQKRPAPDEDIELDLPVFKKSATTVFERNAALRAAAHSATSTTWPYPEHEIPPPYREAREEKTHRFRGQDAYSEAARIKVPPPFPEIPAVREEWAHRYREQEPYEVTSRRGPPIPSPPEVPEWMYQPAYPEDFEYRSRAMGDPPPLPPPTRRPLTPLRYSPPVHRTRSPEGGRQEDHWVMESDLTRPRAPTSLAREEVERTYYDEQDERRPPAPRRRESPLRSLYVYPEPPRRDSRPDVPGYPQFARRERQDSIASFRREADDYVDHFGLEATQASHRLTERFGQYPGRGGPASYGAFEPSEKFESFSPYPPPDY